VKDAAKSNYKFSALVMGVIRSAAFEMTSNGAQPKPAQVAQAGSTGH